MLWGGEWGKPADPPIIRGISIMTSRRARAFTKTWERQEPGYMEAEAENILVYCNLSSTAVARKLCHNMPVVQSYPDTELTV